MQLTLSDQLDSLKPFFYSFMVSLKQEAFFSIWKNLLKEANELLGTRAFSLPHITLLEFWMLPSKEKAMIEVVSKILLQTTSSRLIAKEIERFKSSTLYISLLNDEDLHSLSQKLFNDLLIMGFIPKKKKLHKLVKPLHVTLLKGLAYDDLIFLSDHFQNRTVNLDFIASHIVLLKSLTGNKPWTKVEEFTLQP